MVNLRYRTVVLTDFLESEFDELADARAYADEKASTGAPCKVFTIFMDEPYGESIYTAMPGKGGGPNTGEGDGVREPRRPTPGSSSGAVELELPE